MTMAKKLKMILFDWNGTLIDDIHIVHEALFGEIFRSQGKELPPLEEYYREIPSSMIVYEKHGIVVKKEDVSKLYMEEYLRLATDVELYPGALEILEYLKSKGITIGLVTGQSAGAALPFIYEKFGIGHYFRHSVFESTYKKDSILNLLARTGVNHDECAYVGDAPSDMRHAKQAAVVSVAFVNGRCPLELLTGVGPMFYIDDLRKIKMVIDAYESGLMNGPH